MSIKTYLYIKCVYKEKRKDIDIPSKFLCFFFVIHIRLLAVDGEKV